MTFSDEDKTYLFETIGGIVAAATTAIQQDLSLLKTSVAELQEGQAEMASDILAIRAHTAALSRDVMGLKNRKDREQLEISDRVTALEATVAELQTRLGSKP